MFLFDYTYICHYLPSTHHTSNRLLCNHEIHAVFFCVKNISQQHFWRHVQVIINVLIIHVEPRPFLIPAPTAKWPNLYGITGGRKPRRGVGPPRGGKFRPPTEPSCLAVKGVDFLQSWRIQGSNETGGCGFLHFCSRNRQIYILHEVSASQEKKT